MKIIKLIGNGRLILVNKYKIKIVFDSAFLTDDYKNKVTIYDLNYKKIAEFRNLNFINKKDLRSNKKTQEIVNKILKML